MLNNLSKRMVEPHAKERREGLEGDSEEEAETLLL